MEIKRWDEDDERRVGRALAGARLVLFDLDDQEPTGPQIVFRVLVELVDIERRMKVRAPSPKHLRAQLIEYLHELWEREEAARQRRIDEAAGDDPRVVWGITEIATPYEINTFDSVKMVFRSCLVGKNQVRDWKLMQLLAKGSDVRRASRYFHMGKSRVNDVKALQCAAIWNGVSHLLPKEVGTTKVWKDAAA